MNRSKPRWGCVQFNTRRGKLRKIFIAMVIVCMVLAMSMFAIEPTGPPGDVVLSVGSNLYDQVTTMVPATGVAMNQAKSVFNQYAVSGSNLGMLAGLMRGLIVLILTIALMVIAKDYCDGGRER